MSGCGRLPSVRFPPPARETGDAFRAGSYSAERAPFCLVIDTSAMLESHAEAAYRLGSDRGSPNHGSTLLSKRVMAQIRSPVRVRTRRPVPWRMPVAARRYAPNAG
jgi:hypothetical protein